jgi:hypothetical protein
MVALHITISIIFFTFGFLMRYGLAYSLAECLYNKLPGMAAEPFDEYKVRRFLGETSIKLGCIILLIAMVGIFQPASLKLAVLFGWICFIIIAVGSVTFMDKTNIFRRLRT